MFTNKVNTIKLNFIHVDEYPFFVNDKHIYKIFQSLESVHIKLAKIKYQGHEENL